MQANATVNGHDRTQSGDALHESLVVTLEVRDPEMIADLSRYTAGPDRTEFACAALRIGLLALRQAQGCIDGDTVRAAGDRLLTELRCRLDTHAAAVRESMQSHLEEYFDPAQGRFVERLDRLVRKDGELEAILRRQLGHEDSELARTLAEHLGAASPFMRLLSPDDAAGFLAALRTGIERAMDDQRTRILGQFSLDDRESALSRLVAEIEARHGRLSDAFREQFDRVVTEFDLNSDESALSRLVRRVDDAHRRISREFSLDEEGSALMRMRRDLMEVLDAQRRATSEFETEIKATLAALQARRREAERSTRHGGEFEDEVVSFVKQEAQRLGDTATHTGHVVGLIKNCKVGDAVVEIGPDAIAAGARIAVEAKQMAGCDLRSIRKELETARKNRGAQVGLFVLSARVAPDGLEPLARYGDDIVIVWDAEDPASDVYLRGGLSVARALCTRAATINKARAADAEAIERAIRAVEKQAAGLDDLGKLAENVQRDGGKIGERVRRMRTELERQVEALDGALGDLRSALDDERGME